MSPIPSLWSSKILLRCRFAFCPFFNFSLHNWRRPILCYFAVLGVYAIIMALVYLTMVFIPGFRYCCSIWEVITGISARCCMVAFGWIGVVGLLHLIRGRWRTGVAVWLTMIPAATVTAILLMVASPALLFLSLFGPSEDYFAKNLTIPTGMELAEPLEADRCCPLPSRNRLSCLPDSLSEENDGKKKDAKERDVFPLARRLADTLFTGKPLGPTPEIPSLARLTVTPEGREKLDRYFTGHPEWEWVERDSHRYVLRRFPANPIPPATLDGYYSAFNPIIYHFEKCPRFSYRLKIDPAGGPKKAERVREKASNHQDQAYRW